MNRQLPLFADCILAQLTLQNACQAHQKPQPAPTPAQEAADTTAPSNAVLVSCKNWHQQATFLRPVTIQTIRGAFNNTDTHAVAQATGWAALAQTLDLQQVDTIKESRDSNAHTQSSIAHEHPPAGVNAPQVAGADIGLDWCRRLTGDDRVRCCSNPAADARVDTSELDNRRICWTTEDSAAAWRQTHPYLSPVH